MGKCPTGEGMGWRIICPDPAVLSARENGAKILFQFDRYRRWWYIRDTKKVRPIDGSPQLFKLE